MIYRYQETYSGVFLDYIIFFKKDKIEIDINAIVRINIQHSFNREFLIVNGIIDWSQVDNEIVTTKCQEFCDKIQKLRAFS